MDVGRRVARKKQALVGVIWLGGGQGKAGNAVVLPQHKARKGGAGGANGGEQLAGHIQINFQAIVGGGVGVAAIAIALPAVYQGGQLGQMFFAGKQKGLGRALTKHRRVCHACAAICRRGGGQGGLGLLGKAYARKALGGKGGGPFGGIFVYCLSGLFFGPRAGQGRATLGLFRIHRRGRSLTFWGGGGCALRPCGQGRAAGRRAAAPRNCTAGLPPPGGRRHLTCQHHAAQGKAQCHRQA